MSLTKDALLDALRKVQDPDLRRDITSIGAVKRCSVCDGHVAFTIAAPGAVSNFARRVMAEEIDAAVQGAFKAAGQTFNGVRIEFINGANEVVATFGEGGVELHANTDKASRSAGASPRRAHDPDSPQASASGIPGVQHIVAVGAGKGGVGKSTVAVNIAVGLARKGHAVGLMDGDIYGPSLPTMMGLDAMEPVVLGNRIQPFFSHGVKCMTIGKLVERDKPLIWRGPMAHGAFKQIAEQTDWGELDYLIIDLPPGTGDVSLTMAQLLRLDGAVVVCTPQRVAQDDAVRAAKMFEQLGITVLGVVENMSYFIGDDGKEYDLFGRGGAEQMAQRLGTPYLGGVPINTALRINSDSGDPTANFEGDPKLARELMSVVDQLENQVALAGMRSGAQAPTLSVR